MRVLRRRGVVQMFFDKLTGYGIDRVFEIATANDAHVVFAVWIGMVRDPGRYASIEARTGSGRRILCQRIESFRLRENALNLGFCGIKFLHFKAAQGAKPSRRGQVFRLAHTFQRSVDVLLKIGEKR